MKDHNQQDRLEDEDEYETDSDASSSSSDEGEEEEEEQWSLRVRLLSAVDLPPSLSPSVPLCPWFKFGLVEDVNAALDKVAEEKKREADRAKLIERKKRTLHPKREQEEEESDDEDDGESDGGAPDAITPGVTASTLTLSKTTTDNLNTTSRLLTTLPPNQTRTSTSKIMSRNANGGGGNGADWNEEYRWNTLDSPMESCLVVRLNTRLAPDNNGGSTTIGMGMNNTNMTSSSIDQYGDAASDNGSGGYNLQDNAEESTIGYGIRGLWRKGREQLEQHRRTSTITPGGGNTTIPMGVGQREERAAAVAQFLMRPGQQQHQQDDAATAATSGTGDSSTVGSGSGLRQQDLIDYQQKWASKHHNQNHPEGGGTTAAAMMDYDLATGAVRTVKSEDERDTQEHDGSYAEGLCLGTLTIPLSRLPLEDAFMGNKSAVVERWYQLDDPNVNQKLAREGGGGGGAGENDEEGNGALNPMDVDDEEPTLLHGPRRCPSVLLEITFASSDYLDEVEDDIPTHVDATLPEITTVPESPKPQPTEKKSKEDKRKEEEERMKKARQEPELGQGIIDFFCIVGARDIGNQRNDDGSKGWVQSTPECCVLERYPPNDEFHINNGRNTGLIPQVEWFCFPEGCQLWRGIEAPSIEEMRAGGVSMCTSASSRDADGELIVPTGVSFDSTLQTPTSFSWFVLSSNSDVYGSRLVKTYGTMIRFYVPAPKGIDPTQDDFAQTMTGGGGGRMGVGGRGGSQKARARLWVPIGIVVTTTLPIVGVVEEILLRSCTAMSAKLACDDSTISSSNSVSKLYAKLQDDLYHLIVNFSRPMEGVLHTSIPFLEGERLHVTTSPLDGLPPLPHGGAVASTCRLLGAEGLTLLLAAALTECRILIHSTNVAHVAMVAEVITALIFPFTWQLPYIPVLPKGMLEILDAPLPFFVGVPTVSLQLVDKSTLSEIVVVDLDDVSSFTEYDARRGPRTKIPPALPASVSTSISKAVHLLIKEEDELEKQTTENYFPGLRRSPRLENESLPERMFRIHVALQICSLVRGYQECLFFVSALQPVFNRDRFLRQAPALFEDKRPSVLIDSNFSDRSQRILSPRSKRFLSVLVNSQHFHQMLERLSSEETAFFHEVMEAIEGEDDPAGTGSKNYFTVSFGSPACEEAAQTLFVSLENIEQKIPTYRVNRPTSKKCRVKSEGKIWKWEDDSDEEDFKPFVETDQPFWLLPEEEEPEVAFSETVLKPIMADKSNDPSSSSGDAGVHALSLEYLVELEKNPWQYSSMIDLPMMSSNVEDDGKEAEQNDSLSRVAIVEPRVRLREAIGERRFKAWKIANDHKDDDDLNPATPIPEQNEHDGFDLSSILLNVPDLPNFEVTETTQPRVDTNDREKVRRCLELAFGTGQDASPQQIAEAELALRNPSAQRYLFSVLNAHVQRRNKRSQEESRHTRGANTQQSVSRLEHSAFECIVRLCYAVLEACTNEQNYESAYRLLAGVGFSTQTEQKTVYMTERISIHPIFSDLRLWERVLLLHQQDQQNNDRKEDATEEEEKSGEEKSNAEDAVAESEDTADSDAYDCVVTTLYEMVGYNVPAEEVSRFASRISEERGWFATEKGQALLVLARRLTAKRDEGDAEKTGRADSEFGFVRKDSVAPKEIGGGITAIGDAFLEAEEIAWSHPSMCLVSYERQSGARAFLGNMLGGTTSEIGIHSSHGSNPGSAHSSSHGVPRSTNKKILDANAGDYAGRVAITAMASFGGSAVVTGGIDGSVFLAHTINFGSDKSELDFNCRSTATCTSQLHSHSRLVNGVQLQWGSTGGIERDPNSGSVTCIAASKGSGYRFGGTDKASEKPVGDACPDEEENIASMDGCWVIAGSTAGNLRVWSLQDVYRASCMINRESVSSASSPITNRSYHGSGATSIRLSSADDHGMQDAIMGAPVGGHRGGVSCLDLPPRMYRPDSLVSGGEDGLIKLWSLKDSAGDQDGAQKNSVQSRFFHSHQITSITDFDASDAQGVLTGHEGKINCIKTAWHGDKLLSGGADKTVRLWDLSGAGGKPLATLRGHQLPVTQTHFWGPNMIVSASADRCIHLWDTRVGSSPLFALRYHLSPVSDLLLGNRSEPLMVSAGADGNLATWDFRMLSSAKVEEAVEGDEGSDKAQTSRAIRSPIAKMNHIDRSKSLVNRGSVKLARSIGRDDFSVFSVSDDGIVNEWEAANGGEISSFDSGHRDAISGLSTFKSKDGLRQSKSGGRGAVNSLGGTITCSWDGTVRLRRLSRKSAR